MQSIQELTSGNGLDMSPEKVLPEARAAFEPPSQLYRPCLTHGVEAFDFVFAEKTVNLTKYYRILLYEWFLLIKPGGRLILRFRDNAVAGKADIIRELNSLSLYRDASRLLIDRSENNRHLLVVEKTVSVKRPAGEMDQWTFGIITNGKRIEFVKKTIETIRALNIPQYEIIICGTYSEAIGRDTRYIHFTERDDLGWITRKKNIICENAAFANIAVLHDRIYFDPNFYAGMKRYGSQFDVLSCPVRYYLEAAAPLDTNWDTVAPDFRLADEDKLFHTNGRLDPSDWDGNLYIAGSFIVLKKDTWRKAPWNEGLYWGDAEDIDLSHRQHANGLMLRYNPHALCHAASYSGIMVNQYYEKNDQRLGRFHPGFGRYTLVAMKLLDFMGFRRNQVAMQRIIGILRKKAGASSWKSESKRRH